MCSSTQHIVLGGIAAAIALLITGNDVAGWTAGLTVGLASYLASRIWPRFYGAGACALRPAEARRNEPVDEDRV